MVPEPIQSVCQRLKRRDRGWCVIGGRILERVPRGASAIQTELLPPQPADAAPVVIARIDLEETSPYARPILERIDLGRDFYLGDESGRALVRVGEGGRVHPDVELHLDGPFLEEVERDEAEGGGHASYVRILRTGDPVYVLGRASLWCDEADAGYREAPLSVEILPRIGLHLYDEAAFSQASAWHSLPWYRKLSVLVRNR